MFNLNNENGFIGSVISQDLCGIWLYYWVQLKLNRTRNQCWMATPSLMPRPDQEDDIVYVDAQPIEGSGAPAPAPLQSPHQPGPGVYTYYQRSEGCFPCCGPIGCSVMMIAVFAMIGSPELMRGALYAAGIMVLVSLLSPLFIRRR
jgi:hypothetical protein